MPRIGEGAIEDLPATSQPHRAVKFLTDTGAVASIFLVVPSQLIGLYAIGSLLTGSNIVGGLLGTVWAYAAGVGAYELNRRKYDWTKGRAHAGLHLLLGTLAVNLAIFASAAQHELLFVFAIPPAVAAVLHAGERLTTTVYAALLIGSVVAAIWLYADTALATRLVDWFDTLP